MLKNYLPLTFLSCLLFLTTMIYSQKSITLTTNSNDPNWSIAFQNSGTNIGWIVEGSIDLENALDSGEVYSKIMSREDAIFKLKESKDLLDLEVITQEEYDKIKIELLPIIKKD